MTTGYKNTLTLKRKSVKINSINILLFDRYFRIILIYYLFNQICIQTSMFKILICDFYHNFCIQSLFYELCSLMLKMRKTIIKPLISVLLNLTRHEQFTNIDVHVEFTRVPCICYWMLSYQFCQLRQLASYSWQVSQDVRDIVRVSCIQLVGQFNQTCI